MTDYRISIVGRWAFQQSMRRKTDYLQELITVVTFFKRQAEYVNPHTLLLLRALENGLELYDHDDSLAHMFTCIDNDNRVKPRDSGIVLLFAIDCDLDALRTELESYRRPSRALAQTERHDLHDTVRDGRSRPTKSGRVFYQETLGIFEMLGS